MEELLKALAMVVWVLSCIFYNKPLFWFLLFFGTALSSLVGIGVSVWHLQFLAAAGFLALAVVCWGLAGAIFKAYS